MKTRPKRQVSADEQAVLDGVRVRLLEPREQDQFDALIVTEHYDDAGNVAEIAYNTSHSVLSLEWDSQYQLASVSNGTSEVERYTYDPIGRRLTTTTDSGTIVHVYDGIHCIADLEEDGDLMRSYTYGPGIDNPLAMTTFSAGGTNTYYYLTDHLGSVLALTDEDGALVESYEYDAWGRVRVCNADFEELEASAYGNRHTFQGREYSWETGLYYFRARWYDPVTGRWLSKDPIGISGGLNQYVAFNNAPTVNADPFGLAVILMSDNFRDVQTARTAGYLHGNDVYQGIGSPEQLVSTLEHHAARHGKVKSAQIVGHGGGAGTSFINGRFRWSELSGDQKRRFRSSLADNAEVIFFSCTTTDTQWERDILQDMANDIDANVFGTDLNIAPAEELWWLVRNIRAAVQNALGLPGWRKFTPESK